VDAVIVVAGKLFCYVDRVLNTGKLSTVPEA
jgi:hypothetical protein